MPIYLKFILTFTGDSVIETDEISRILMLSGSIEENTNEMHITNREIFTKYADATFDLLKLPQSVTKEDLMQKCDNDYERILDVAELFGFGVDKSQIMGALDCKLAAYLMNQMSKGEDTTAVNMLLRVL
jgi:hypothetical protein